MFVPYQDGNYLFFRASTEKTIENIRKLSPHDAEAYPKFLSISSARMPQNCYSSQRC
jgi:hypothetical protein